MEKELHSLDKELEKRIKELEVSIEKNRHKIPDQLYRFEQNYYSFTPRKNKMKLSNHIFIARVVVSLSCVFALLKYPDYWFVSLPILFATVVFGGMVEAIFVEKETAKNDKKK